MKALRLLAVLAFLAGLSSACQKEDIVNVNQDDAIVKAGNLKTGEINLIADLILKIEDYVSEEIIAPGIGNALISKLENSSKNFTKGNDQAGLNILQAVLNQLEDLVAEGVLDPETGEELIYDVRVINGTNWECGQSFHDARDGNYYQTALIGEQCWMAENLAWLPSVSPSTAGSYYDPYYYVYGYEGSVVAVAMDEPNYSTYGVLYNHFAALSACPEGWHLPSDTEWSELTSFLGGTLPAGPKLKSTTGWYDDGNGYNTCGFNALPAGYRESDKGPFEDLGKSANFWSSTPIEGTTWNARSRSLYYDYSSIVWGERDKHLGFSVRCLKN